MDIYYIKLYLRKGYGKDKLFLKWLKVELQN